MAVSFPDILQHNNPSDALVDSNFIRGGRRSPVANLTALYALSTIPDQLKAYSTVATVANDGSGVVNRDYLLTDITNIGNSSGWTLALPTYVNGVVDNGDSTVGLGGTFISPVSIALDSQNITITDTNSYWHYQDGGFYASMGNSGGATANLTLSAGGGSAMSYTTNAGQQDIAMTGSGGIQITDSINGRGLQGEAYYAPTDGNTYVQKNYVDNAISGAAITFGNGVTPISTIVGLGGSLSSNTTISLGTSNFTIADSHITGLTLNSGAGASLYGGTLGTGSGSISTAYNGISMIFNNTVFGGPAMGFSLTPTGMALTDPLGIGLQGAAYYGTNYTANTYVQKQYVDTSVALQNTNRYSGKTIRTIGDSYSNFLIYQPYLANIFGFTYTNNSVSGSEVVPGHENDVGDGTRRSSFVERVYNDFLLSNSANFPNYVIIFGGTNDIGYQNAPGYFTDLITPTFTAGQVDQSSVVGATFYGSLRWIVKYINANAPLTEILFITPIQTIQGAYQTNGLDPRLQYPQQIAFIDAIKAVGAAYAVPVADLFSTCLINYETNSTYMQSDKIHPNTPGWQNINYVLKGFLDNAGGPAGTSVGLGANQLVRSNGSNYVSLGGVNMYDPTFGYEYQLLTSSTALNLNKINPATQAVTSVIATFSASGSTFGAINGTSLTVTNNSPTLGLYSNTAGTNLHNTLFAQRGNIVSIDTILDNFSSYYSMFTLNKLTATIAIGGNTTTPGGTFEVNQSSNGIGTASTTATVTTVTGVNTQFLNTFKIGDNITINGETHSITAIASNTSLTTAAWTNTNTALAYTLAGNPKFTVRGNGLVTVGSNTPTAFLDVSAPTSNYSSFRLRDASIDPSVNNSGDVWINSGTLKYYDGANSAIRIVANLLQAQTFGSTKLFTTGFGLLGSTTGQTNILVQATTGGYNFNIPISAGTAGQALTSQGGGSTAMTWSTVMVNPMTTVGDIILGGTSGAAGRLAIGSSGTVLTSSGTTASWVLPVYSQAIVVTLATSVTMVTGTQYIFEGSSAATYTLPSASTTALASNVMRVINAGYAAITLSGTMGDYSRGTSNLSTYAVNVGCTVDLVPEGGVWQLVRVCRQIPLRLTGSGTGVATTISIAHGLIGITSSSIAQVTPASSAAVSSTGYYVTTDATNVNIIYTTAPAVGTGNLVYNIMITP